MIGPKPDFVDSPYFDPINWRLLPGAPKEVVREYKAYLRAMEPPKAPTDEEIREAIELERKKQGRRKRK